MAEKPTVAFVLSLVGAILVIINGLIIAVLISVLGAWASLLVPGVGGLVIIIG
ncbi:MAG: hypothetical protein QW304_07425 [Thermoproteota archaeon]